MLEAIALCIMGAVVHYFIEPKDDRSSAVGHVVLAVVVGVIEYSFLGDVTNALVMTYIGAGYAAPSIVYNLLAQKAALTTPQETPPTPQPPVPP